MADQVGSDRGQVAPTGTVTVVLGDVAGSTRLWQQHPSAMTVASRRMTELTAELASRHGGHLPREQGEGDNLVAAFAVSSDAIRFVVALDEALAAEPWPDAMEIGMRLGVHVGDVSWDAGTGYLGPTFNRCARIRDLGHARQVLLSQAAGEIVADGLPPGWRLEDLGEHRLRDLSRAERVLQLLPSGDTRTWPPLKSVSSLPNNLPIPVTSLVGREDDIAHVVGLLADHRLVTLTGAGGSGKTRLAQHVASEALHVAPDGAWWVDLMPLTEDEQVPAAIAEAAGLLDVTTAEQLPAAIGDARMLLVLDNCEHLVDAVADLAEDLLRGCRNVRVLTTSRETLGVDGEHNVRVRTLDDSDAAELFVQRANAVAQLSQTPDDELAVAEICRRLDGIPLAIELAAARTRLLSPRQIADGLDDRFRLLTSGARRARSRQRTLEASVAWSYDLLDDDEKAVLSRLGVHPAAFSLEGAVAVGGLGDDGAQTLDVLDSLVEKSLVAVRPDDGGRRYRLLETIKQYALDRLAERGEGEAARDAHLEFVLDVMRDMEARLVERLNDPTSWMRARTWRDDVRAARSWAVLNGRSEDVIQLHWPTYALSLVTTSLGEAVAALEPLLDDTTLGLQERTRVHAMLVAFKGAMGDFGGAAELSDEGLRLARELDDDMTLAGVLASSALARGFSRGEGLDLGLEAVARSRRYGSSMVAISGYCLAVAAVWGKDAVGPHIPVLEEAVRAAKQAKLAPIVVMVETVIAGHLLGTGRLAEGVAMAEATLEFARRHAPRALPGHAYVVAMWGRLWSGRDDAALELAEESMALAGPPGTLSHNLALLTRLTANVVVGVEPEQVSQDAEQLITSLRGAGADFHLVLALLLRAQGHVLVGEHEAARERLREADAMFPDEGWTYARGWSLWVRSQDPAATPRDRLEATVTILRILLPLEWTLQWVLTFLGVGAQALHELGREREAARLLGRIGETRELIGQPPTGAVLAGTDRVVTELEASIDDEVLATEAGVGAAMSTAEVVTMLDEILTDLDPGATARA